MTEAQRAAQDECRQQAARLERLAAAYRDMADGKLNPHGPEMKAFAPTAIMVVKTLVNDWV